MRAAASREQTASAWPVRQVSEPLLAWYDSERRDLPWRSPPGQSAEPYAVWLSEIMLQQTTVKAVIPYFHKFLRRWPSVSMLAAASLDEVLSAWAGLGYYSRARNLHKCAQIVANELDGHFPQSEAELRKLPGVGPYTAAAISAIAFGNKATPVDGNIERVMARLFAVREPLPDSKGRLRELAGAVTPDERAGDFAQALMDLGASICSPKRPSCLVCPLSHHCAANAAGIAAELPARRKRSERPLRRGFAYLALREDGHILLRRRPEAGLLGGMMEVPSGDWAEDWPAHHEALRAAPVHGDWWQVPGLVSHTFTHFRLELIVYRAVVGAEAALTFWADPGRCSWIPRRKIDDAALPSIMRKVIAAGLREV